MPKGQQYSETDAMKDLEHAFEQIDDAARSRVISWASAKYNVGVTRSDAATTASQSAGPSSTAQPGGNIKSFMAGKKPENFYERVACLAYFLEKVEKTESIKTADITTANTNARLSRLSNAGVFIADATAKYGYLTSIARGVVALSARGEAMVEALPDRDKVQAALEANPFRRGGKKKKAKKG